MDERIEALTTLTEGRLMEKEAGEPAGTLDVQHYGYAVLLHPAGPLSRDAAEEWQEKADYMREALTFAAMQRSHADADREAGGILLIALQEMDDAAAGVLEGEMVVIDAPEEPGDALEMARHAHALIGCALREELLPSRAIHELCARVLELVEHGEDWWRDHEAGQAGEVQA